VTKLVKTRIRLIRIFYFQNSSNANSGIYFITQIVMHWFRSIK